MEIITKEYYIFENNKNKSIKELENELKSIKSLSKYELTNYHIRKYSVIKEMIDRFKNGNYENPYRKPIKNYDVYDMDY